MLRSSFKLLISVLALIACINVFAQTTEDTTTTTTSPSGATVEKHVIITTTPPPAKEITPTPEGGNCFNVEAGYYQGVWVPEHTVCQYKNSQEASCPAWVAGYWACTKYNMTGECTNWDWRPAHCVKSFEVY